MGAGASVEWAEKLQSATEKDLLAAVADLSAEKRAELLAALPNIQAALAASPAAATSAEADSEAAPPGICCSQATYPRSPEKVAEWPWKVQDWRNPSSGEKYNYLAHYIPRDPNYGVRSERGSLPSKNIASTSVEYTIILPENFAKDRAEPYPLIINLHPGGAGAEHLIDPAGAARTGRDLPAPREIVWASFTMGKFNFCQEYKDGSDKWETFMMQDFIPFVESTYNCGGQQSRRYLTGICMGGNSVCKFAFKYPQEFAAAAIQQPGIPAGVNPKELVWNDLVSGMGEERPPNPRPDLPDEDGRKEGIKAIGAASVAEADEGFFREYMSPIAYAIDNADNIRKSGIELFLDVGDEDKSMLHNAAELLHRQLWYHRIQHEYHLVRGGNHEGSSWRRRGPEAIDFLFRSMEQALNPVEILDKEDREYAAWTVNPSKDSVPEPPKPKDNFINPPVGALNRVFSDRSVIYKVEYKEAPKRHRYGYPTDGVEVMMGHPWRMPKPE